MKKDSLEQQLSRFLDGELSERERIALESALESDPEMAGRLEDLENALRVHKTLIPEPKDDAFINAELGMIHERIRAEKNPERKMVEFPRLNPGIASLAAAAAVVIGVAGLWIWNANVQSSPTGAFENDPFIAQVETDIAGASSMVYVDDQSGWTIVWVDEPDPSDPDQLAG